MKGSQMTKKIWSCDVTIYYKWSHRADRLRMKFENVEGSDPTVCYQKACDTIRIMNAAKKEEDENAPTIIILGGCAVFNFEE